MSSIGKSFALILIGVIAISFVGLLTIKPVKGQSGQTPNYSDYIPTPEVPQFTLRFVQSVYDEIVTNPYTGAKTTQQVNNSTIEIIIKNQPFTPYNYGWQYMGEVVNSSTSLWYNVQFKGNYSQNWTDLYFTNRYPTQSNSSDYTILDVPQNASGTTSEFSTVWTNPTSFPAGGEIDFEIQAIIGGWFPPVLYSSYNLPLNFIAKNSNWSSAQTITIPSSSVLPTSTPTVPELSWLAIVPLLLSVFSVAVIVRHRKTANLKPKTLSHTSDRKKLKTLNFQ